MDIDGYRYRYVIELESDFPVSPVLEREHLYTYIYMYVCRYIKI